LSYVVAGSGGAGMTVMRTTFLGLRAAFDAWLNGQWQKVSPYSKREVKEFPKYGKTGVYWFDMPETYTFAESFSAKNIITKFGSVPDLYNYLTWITAHIFPSAWIESSQGIEFFSRVSYAMTKVTDPFSGVGVAIASEIEGEKDGKKAKCHATFTHENTAVAAGMGTGSVVQLLLNRRLNKPGIWPVEQALSTDLFIDTLKDRGISIEQKLQITNVQ
ncbi:MAG: saccharopine dehydrogenase, partial [Spirulinaceae cyanobacterium]